MWYAVSEYGGLSSGFVHRFRPDKYEDAKEAAGVARELSRDTPGNTFYVVPMVGPHQPPIASFKNGEDRYGAY
jgi:hypothetical protein